MAAILNITNGDSAASLMRDGGMEGTILPWRDVLHEGPVPAELSLQQMSRIRAEYIASCGWGDVDNILKGFQERDQLLNDFKKYDEVVLWFEHEALQVLSIEPQPAGRLFHQNQQREQRVYLGDASYWNMVNNLLAGDQALLKLSSGRALVQSSDCSDLLQLTDIGTEVRKGALHRMSLHWVPYLIGGVEISTQTPWFWDAKNTVICKWKATQ